MIRDTFETFFEPISLVLKLSTAPKDMVVNNDAQSIGHRMMDSEVEISMDFFLILYLLKFLFRNDQRYIFFSQQTKIAHFEALNCAHMYSSE